jgi:predicted DsbA family dithiol-disulfide isomerase
MTVTENKPVALKTFTAAQPKIHLEVWSDIHCPWCYIGKRRFERALDQFEHKDQVEIIWRSFQLDPDAPPEYKGNINDMLVEKKGISRAKAEAMHKHVTDLAAQEGLTYQFDKVRLSNSFDAHRLIHFAAEHGLQDKMQERLFYAYFTEGLYVGDHDVLAGLAAEVGLNADDVRAMLKTNQFANDVRADQQLAYDFGSNGVPFFVFERKYGISGAQPTELFLSALNQIWGELPQPIAAQDDAMCADDNCAI